MPTLAVSNGDHHCKNNADEASKGSASLPVRGRVVQSLEVLAQDFREYNVLLGVETCNDRYTAGLDGRVDFGNAIGHTRPHRWNVVSLSVRDRPKPLQK